MKIFSCGAVAGWVIAICVGISPAPGAESDAATQPAPLAWAHFDDGPEEYAGTPYLWLSRTDIHLRIAVKPEPGHTLELLWGAKDDQRAAVATINGKKVGIRGGGYDGFRWLKIALPAAVGGEAYDITLQAALPKAAFLGGVRLTDGAAPSEEVAPQTATHRMTVSTGERTGLPAAIPAFPDMEALWNREPPEPQAPPADAEKEAAFRRAEQHGRRVAEMLFRCRRFVDGWLAQADPETGLIPRNLNRSRDIWNAKDSAADNYPFMVLTCALTDRALFEGRMRDMLRTETKLTSRVDRLPDTWSFSKQAFDAPDVNLGAIIFGGSEYVKDGLMPLTEWLGPSPWSERMLGIVDDIWKHAPVETPRGNIPATNVEVNGEMLQVLSRLYWMTGDEKYLDWAVRLGDYYLLDGNNPGVDFDQLRLRDHGCEITSGLSELYVAVSFARPKKKQEYQQPIHAMFDRILEVGRRNDGMLYNAFSPKTGKHHPGICDTWGYNYNGIYAVYMVDGTETYRQAVRHVLGNLEEHLTDYHWGSADEYADSIEGALNLINREPDASAARWIDSEIRDMWRPQRPDGVVEGWHGDGNSARTAIMYAFWKTQGLWITPWRADVCVGAVRHGHALCVSLGADEPWTGRVRFDQPRHKTVLHLPIDYPRINQFPEWFVAEPGKTYTIREAGSDKATTYTAAQLHRGVEVALQPGLELRWEVVPSP